MPDPDVNGTDWRRTTSHSLRVLPEIVEGIEVAFPPGMPEPIRRLMDALGVTVVEDPDVKGRYAAS